MNFKNRIIPPGIKKLSDIEGFELENGIVDKTMMGCGATYWAIKSPHPTVLISPRTELLRSKHMEHHEEDNTFLAIGVVTEKEIKNYVSNTPVPKILVSFDSLKKVMNCINQEDFRFVIDEMQHILTDATYRSEVNTCLIELMKTVKYKTYLSATPALYDLVTPLPEYFGDLTYYKYVWGSSDVIKPILQQTKSPINTLINHIKSYLNGCWYSDRDRNGNLVESKECIIFLNSVNNIIDIIKKTKLKPEDVNIICSGSYENDSKISKIGCGWKRGRILMKHEKRPMFTFCTSTAYAGCDIHSPNCTIIVCSDAKKRNMRIDIANELVQAVGRIRDENNPFRLNPVFIYNVTGMQMSNEEFDKYMSVKILVSNKDVERLNQNTDPIYKQHAINELNRLQMIDKFGYKYTMYNPATSMFEFNKVAYVGEMAARRIQSQVYTSGISVMKEINSTSLKVEMHEQVNFERQVECSTKINVFADTMKEYCFYKKSPSRFANEIRKLEAYMPKLKVYYDSIGASKIKALAYIEKRIKAYIDDKKQIYRSKYLIKNKFNVGSKYTNKEIKNMLAEIYRECGIKSTAKATDINQHFKTKRATICGEKREEGLELIMEIQ